MLKAFFSVLICSLLLIALPGDLLAQERVSESWEESERDRVLVLASYHHGQQWTDSLISGLRTGLNGLMLNPADPEFELYLEYMDSKRIPFTRSLENRLEEFLLSKYRGRIDYLVVTDNNAFNWALERRNRMFRGIPIVFAGINDFYQYDSGSWTQIYGVMEKG
jgi:hypothetical protein